MDDAGIMLEWQSDPSTRRFFRNPSIPNLDEHRRWLKHRFADPNCVFNLIMHGSSPAGLVRLDRRPDGGGFEVSILVAPEKRRLGLGLAGLRLVRQMTGTVPLYAEVLEGNAASEALFARAGYRRVGRHFVHAGR